jgi:hypothetical protein
MTWGQYLSISRFLVHRLAQVAPTILPELISDADPDKARKAIAAMMRMKKPDIETLRRAAG